RLLRSRPDRDQAGVRSADRLPCGVPAPVPGRARLPRGQRRRARFPRVQPRPRRAPRQCGAERAERGRCVALAAGSHQLRRGASGLPPARRVLLVEEPPRRDRLHREVSTMTVRTQFRAIATAALAAAVAVSAIPARAQSRLSLAERVERLERQQAGTQSPGGAVDLVNQITALQSQVQTLQGQVEELRHALDEANRRNRDQYVDLDSRIARLEGTPGSAAAAAAGTAAASAEQPPEITLDAPAP